MEAKKTQDKRMLGYSIRNIVLLLVWFHGFGDASTMVELQSTSSPG